MTFVHYQLSHCAIAPMGQGQVCGLLSPRAVLYLLKTKDHLWRRIMLPGKVAKINMLTGTCDEQWRQNRRPCDMSVSLLRILAAAASQEEGRRGGESARLLHLTEIMAQYMPTAYRGNS